MLDIIVSIVAVVPTQQNEQPKTIVYDASGQCPRKILNNDQLYGPFLLDMDWQHKITIKNGTPDPAVIKIADASGHRYTLFFVDRYSVAESIPIPDGNYRVQFAMGGILAADCETILRPKGIGEFPPVQLQTRRVSDREIFDRITYTLHPVPKGNVRPKKISTAEFNKD